jgi:C_GCAxxG_C_C family probable redox protein
VGKAVFDRVDDILLRVGTPFGRGLGKSQQQMCGALAGGVIVIGALYGRSDKEADSDLCHAVASRFQERWLEAFGHTKCHDLREAGVCGTAEKAWKGLIMESMGILLDVLRDVPQIEAELPTDE